MIQLPACVHPEWCHVMVSDEVVWCSECGAVQHDDSWAIPSREIFRYRPEAQGEGGSVVRRDVRPEEVVGRRGRR